ncbi:coiled-coil-helix-coiled-coil-helix domain containing 3a isoform X3 [Pungitius pungitius]|uniref:coiled-coil-helix-coiled-coil-helix domain containing 3a isoform X3 n=1 Tax=Pungitius pungitius TaxID=134920 RepID=UPI002E124273
MGANSSTRRVSFESDEHENISVVKGIRLSENVINRMREPDAPPKNQRAPSPPPSMAPTLLPSPLLRPVPPLFDPITSLPPPPSLVEPVSPSAPPPPTPSAAETVAAPSPPPPQPPKEQVTPIVAPLLPEAEPLSSPPVSKSVAILSPPLHPSGDALSPQPAEPFSAPPLPEYTAPSDPVAPPPQPPVDPVPLAPAPEPVVGPESNGVPPPAAAAVDEEALRKKISDELYKTLEQDRVKAEQELQAWITAEKARVAAQAEEDARAQVPGEVSRLLSAERAAAQESVQQAVMRERISTEDEKRRAQLFAKQLAAREADLNKQDAFYREQVARLEERSAQFYKVTTENYHNAADQVNAKFKRYEAYPVCADVQSQILACYKENVGKTLNCSNIAALYLQCVNNAKQNDKSVHAPPMDR